MLQIRKLFMSPAGRKKEQHNEAASTTNFRNVPTLLFTKIMFNLIAR